MTPKTKTVQQYIVKDRKIARFLGRDVPERAKVVRRYNAEYLDDDIYFEWEVEMTPEEIQAERDEKMRVNIRDMQAAVAAAGETVRKAVQSLKDAGLT